MVWFPSFSHTGLNCGGGGGLRVDGSTGSPAKACCDNRTKITTKTTVISEAMFFDFISILLIGLGIAPKAHCAVPGSREPREREAESRAWLATLNQITLELQWQL